MEVSTTHNPVLAYRPDIDGLRAIAVLSVIAFHIDENLLPGGFLGVDVFFVISGYLITLLLLKNIERTGRLDIVGFYRRRVQRILPALLFMLSGTALAGFVIMAPGDFKDLMVAAFASVLSVANLYFHSELETGYFAADTGDVPLLHVWSLGVEEQFYLLWPFLVLLLVMRVKSSRNRIACVSVALIASLVLAHWLAPSNPSFAYYMLPTRAWELLAGALAAFLVAGGFSFHGRWRHVPGLAGLGLIFAGLVLVTASDTIPGLDVVPLVLGAMLLVLSPADAMAGRLLSVRPMVAVGLISYSAYLWHWPLLAFLRYGFVEINWQVGTGVVVITLALATISYWFVERPLRQLRLPPRRVFVRYFVGPAGVVLLVAGSIVHAVDNKVPWVYSWEEYESLQARTNAAYSYDYNCQYSEFALNDFSEARCVYPKGAQPSILLLGDSNAAHYLGMLRSFAAHYGFSLRNASQSSCPILLGANVDWVDPKYAAGCSRYLSIAEHEIENYETVIIGGSWTYFDRLSSEDFRNRIDATIAVLADRVESVVVLAKAPVFPGYNQECEVRKKRLTYLDCDQRFVRADRDFAINVYLRDVVGKYKNADYFDARHVLCRNDICSPYLNGNPVYYNSTHLSMEGSAAIGDHMLSKNDPAVSVLAHALGARRDIAAMPEVADGVVRP